MQGQSCMLRRVIMSLLLLLPTVTAQGGAPQWEPRFLKDYPLAVCNDGTPAAYYYRAGDAGARRWLVYLDGEGWCWDAGSCSGPWEVQHGTSATFPRTREELKPRADRWLSKGIFDTKRSPLLGAHVAFVKSCSNDAFMGDKSPAPNFATLPPEQQHAGNRWYFRGRRIIEAVFEDLRKYTGLGAKDNDRLIYGGCSAGARGAMVSLDYVAQNLAGKAETVGLLDSGFWVPINPPDARLWRSFEYQQMSALKMANATPFIAESCARVFPGEEQWKCLNAAFRLPFVRTPYFLSHSQYDVFGISMNLFGHFMPGVQLNQTQLMFAEEYRKRIIKYLPFPASGSRTVVFSPACYIHCMNTQERFYTVVANGVKLAELLYWWLNAASASDATARFLEKCKGFNCGRNAVATLQDMTLALHKGQQQVGSG